MWLPFMPKQGPVTSPERVLPMGLKGFINWSRLSEPDFVCNSTFKLISKEIPYVWLNNANYLLFKFVNKHFHFFYFHIFPLILVLSSLSSTFELYPLQIYLCGEFWSFFSWWKYYFSSATLPWLSNTVQCTPGTGWWRWSWPAWLINSWHPCWTLEKDTQRL